MAEAHECTLEAGRGLSAENRPSGKREVTLVSAESWRDVCRELGADVPWYFRRANLLVEGVNLAAAIGRSVHVGETEIRIHGETKPCKIMDAQHDGLREALVPECRGGVFGEVLKGGKIRVGDRVVVMTG